MLYAYVYITLTHALPTFWLPPATTIFLAMVFFIIRTRTIFAPETPKLEPKRTNFA